MRISRQAIKQNAKMLISETKPSPILIGLVFIGIMYILQILSVTVIGQHRMYQQVMDQFLAGNYDYIPVAPKVGTVGSLLSIAIALMTLIMSTGFTIYCLNVVQRRKSGAGNLFDGFAILFKILWLSILMYLFIFLWTLLFIIPGIVAAYRYRQALYIMVENPDRSALDCIRESKRMMNGHKGELFVLDLSFIGWQLLTFIPFVSIWVTPYVSITYANYYLALRDMPQPNWGQASPSY